MTVLLIPLTWSGPTQFLEDHCSPEISTIYKKTDQTKISNFDISSIYVNVFKLQGIITETDLSGYCTLHRTNLQKDHTNFNQFRLHEKRLICVVHYARKSNDYCIDYISYYNLTSRDIPSENTTYVIQVEKEKASFITQIDTLCNNASLNTQDQISHLFGNIFKLQQNILSLRISKMTHLIALILNMLDLKGSDIPFSSQNTSMAFKFNSMSASDKIILMEKAKAIFPSNMDPVNILTMENVTLFQNISEMHVSQTHKEYILRALANLRNETAEKFRNKRSFLGFMLQNLDANNPQDFQKNSNILFQNQLANSKFIKKIVNNEVALTESFVTLNSRYENILKNEANILQQLNHKSINTQLFELNNRIINLHNINLLFEITKTEEDYLQQLVNFLYRISPELLLRVNVANPFQSMLDSHSSIVYTNQNIHIKASITEFLTLQEISYKCAPYFMPENSTFVALRIPTVQFAILDRIYMYNKTLQPLGPDCSSSLISFYLTKSNVHCKFETLKVNEQAIYFLKNRTFFVTPFSDTLNITCKNNFIAKIYPKGTHILKNVSNCLLNSRQITLFNEHFTNSDTSFELSNLNLTSEIFHNSSFLTPNLTLVNVTLPVKPKFPHHTVNHTLGTIIIILLFIVITIISVKLYRKIKENRKKKKNFYIRKGPYGNYEMFLEYQDTLYTYHVNEDFFQSQDGKVLHTSLPSRKLDQYFRLRNQLHIQVNSNGSSYTVVGNPNIIYDNEKKTYMTADGTLITGFPQPTILP